MHILKKKKDKTIFTFSSLNRVIFRSSSFISGIYENISFNILKTKILTALFLYTGYFIINIIRNKGMSEEY